MRTRGEFARGVAPLLAGEWADRAVQQLVITLQLGLLLWAMYLFRIEEGLGLMRILPVIFAGFVIHSALPLWARKPFFLVLSLASIVAVLGAVYGAALVLLGVGLIAICHLPVSLKLRALMLCLAGLGMAAVRGEWISPPGSGQLVVILPILASMFMFRTAVYLYDIRHEKTPASLSERLSYFFLLPNVCFPLFPVIDYQTYRRTYYDAEPRAIYQRGIDWILRGLVHLVLYRVVYHAMVPQPAEVTTLGVVVQSMLATYLLYLRVSGLFHIVVGILCLFGHNLPETHHRYYLASSFNDYWRRINIYWKDFMMKLFYYPVLTRFKKLGLTASMVIATLAVFVGTWVLHAYQWFWLRGSFPLTGPDALFWGILGVLVVLNSLLEFRRGRKRRIGAPAWTFRGALSLSLRTVGMFVFLTILWSLWSSATVGEWLTLVSAARNTSLVEVGLLGAGLAALIGIGVAFQYARSEVLPRLSLDRVALLRSPPVQTITVALLLVLLGSPGLPVRADGRAGELLASVRSGELNQRDQELQERGYYEGLLVADHQPAAMSRSLLGTGPDGWEGVREAGAIRDTGDLLEYELLPSLDILVKESPFRTNRWGMKDREYPREKPEGTLRFALLGSSHVMGVGVENGQAFDAVVEDRLNDELTREAHSAYEVMNFAVGGYSVIQSELALERKALDFAPDVVLFSAHANDERRLIANLSRVIQQRVEISDPELRAIIARSGATPDQERSEIDRRLRPHSEALMDWTYRRVASSSLQANALAVWLYVPLTTETTDRASDRDARERLARLARQAGLVTWSIEDAYRGQKKSAITLAPWDGHPNPRGHRLLADRLYDVLSQNRELLVHLADARALSSAGPAQTHP